MDKSLYKSAVGAAAVAAWYDFALAKLRFPHESLWLDTLHGRTHVLACGNPGGKPLVLLHGLNVNALVWMPQLAALKGYRIYAIDLLGQPGRSAATAPFYLGDDLVHWLMHVFCGLGLRRVTLIGLSLGGYIAMRFAAALPQMVDRLVLLSPAGITNLSPDLLQRLIAANLPCRDHVTAMRPILEDIYLKGGDSMEADSSLMEDLIAIVQKHIRPARDWRTIISLLATAMPLAAHILAALQMPTMVIIGEQDRLFNPNRVIARARAAIPGLAAAEIITSAGHAMIYQRATAMNARLLTFLEETD